MFSMLKMMQYFTTNYKNQRYLFIKQDVSVSVPRLVLIFRLVLLHSSLQNVYRL